MVHYFSVELACRFGIIESILISNFQHWLTKNRANHHNFYDGRYWTFNSVEAFQQLFPYVSYDKVRRALERLISAGVLIVGNYNKDQRDRTRWYTLSENYLYDSDSNFGFCQMQSGELPNASSENAKALPNNKHTDVLDNDESLSLFNSSNEDLNAVDNAPTHKSSYQWLIDYWNEHAVTRGYRGLTRIDGKRLTATRARLKEYGADAFKQAIDKACASDFLRGQNKSGFTLTFDWMIKPTNFPKVLEGNYDNPQTTPTTNDTDNHNAGHLREPDNAEGTVQTPRITIDEERMRMWETKRILIP